MQEIETQYPEDDKIGDIPLQMPQGARERESYFTFTLLCAAANTGN